MPLDEEALCALVRSCELANAALTNEAAQAVAARGVNLGEMRGLTTEHYAALYGAANDLCEQERFQEAMQIAMQLSALAPSDHRYTLLAAITMHRLERWPEAAALYGTSLAARLTPTAMFRLGECYSQLGNDEQALECFSLAEEMCADQDEHALVRAWASESASAIRSI